VPADGTQTLAGYLLTDVPTDGVEDINARSSTTAASTPTSSRSRIAPTTATSGQFVCYTKGAGA
jgi:hypothetical protein